MSTSQSPKIILCTGANRGLGFEILHVAALRDSSAIYILASRNVASGKEALQELRKLGINSEVEVIQLDVTNDSHIIAAVELVETKYGRLDVLINNAGILNVPTSDDSLTSFRQTYNSVLDTNITSTAVVTRAFDPLLRKSQSPKVINITSGLASIQRLKTRTAVGNYGQYISSKTGLNGMTVHAQLAENARFAAEEKQGKAQSRIRYYVVAPGLLKTGFTNFLAGAKDPKLGAEVVVQLVADENGTYEGGNYYEYEEGEIRIVPW